MKKLFLAFILCTGLLACNNETQTETDINNADSGLIETDTAGDARGARGTGTDNTGGTPGPGTITDTAAGKVDTLDHRSEE